MGYDKRVLCEQIEKLRAEGKTFTAIAQAVHASRQTVQRIAATFGIQKRKWARVKMPTPVVAPGQEMPDSNGSPAATG